MSVLFGRWEVVGGVKLGPWVKWPGVNFTNVLCTAFAHVDPKCIKRYWGFDWIITLSGSTRVKAVRRTLMKLSPGVNFINIFCAIFSYESLFWQLFLVTFWLWQKICTKNLCVKCWCNQWQWSILPTFWCKAFSTGQGRTYGAQILVVSNRSVV